MHRRLHQLALALALALTLAACGGEAAVEVQGESTSPLPSETDGDAATEPMRDTDEMSEMHDEHDDMDDAMSAGSETEVPEGALVVEIEMVDIAFAPASLQVPAGEPVRLVFTNTGSAVHEAVIGDEHVQQEHDEAMRSGGGHDDHGGGHHGDVPSITLEPGESGELVHTFDAVGTTLIGCHVPGHYAAGMVIEVEVTG